MPRRRGADAAGRAAGAGRHRRVVSPGASPHRALPCGAPTRGCSQGAAGARLPGPGRGKRREGERAAPAPPGPPADPAGTEGSTEVPPGAVRAAGPPAGRRADRAPSVRSAQPELRPLPRAPLCEVSRPPPRVPPPAPRPGPNPAPRRDHLPFSCPTPPVRWALRDGAVLRKKRLFGSELLLLVIPPLLLSHALTLGLG